MTRKTGENDVPDPRIRKATGAWRGTCAAARSGRPPHATESALQERVKELECLYAISQACARPGLTTAEMFHRAIEILPAAWRFPKLAYAYIAFDGDSFCRGERPEAEDIRLTASIVVQGAPRGDVVIGYPGAAIAKTPFLDEERRLLEGVAQLLGQMVERLEARRAQEALREQLWHAERLVTIGQLASGVAHELNEPLGSILGFTQLLAKTPRMPRAARRDLERIESATLHARDIIRKLMLFARDSAPKLDPVDLNRLAKECADLLMWRLEDGGVDIRFALDPGFPVMDADEAQLRQVIINLVINAIQAMPEGGVLTLGTARTRHGPELRVDDTGVGIAPEHLPRIFDPFFTTKDVDQGTGLGLSVVHGIVAAHKGEILAENRPGGGVRVRVVFSSGHQDPAAPDVPRVK